MTRLRATLVLLVLTMPGASPAHACVVGTGTIESCTEAALTACLFPGGTVTFDCGGPATITITATKNITAATVIDGTGAIQIKAGAGLNIVLSQQAALTVHNLTIIGNETNYGIYQPDFSTAELILSNVTLADNLIGVISNMGPVTVTGSYFLGNAAGLQGSSVTVHGTNFTANGSGIGAITATVTDSYFAGNTNRAISGTSLTVRNCTFHENSGGSGGAIVSGDPSTVTNSTFFGNTALNAGGAIHHIGSQPLAVTNCTFWSNGAPVAGAISVGGSGSVILVNTIMNGSISGGNCGAGVVDGGHNIDSGTTCGFTGTGCASGTGSSFCNTNALLGALLFNGGPTPTHAIQAGSPAIDAGDDAVCAAAPVGGLDQRGFTRPGAGATHCSIGAYEFNGVQPTTTTTSTSTSTSSTSSSTSSTTSTSSSSSSTSSSTTTSITTSTSSSSTTSTLPPECGNEVVDPNESCGEPGLPACAAGQLCLECTCRQLGDCQEGGGAPDLFDVIEMIDIVLKRQEPDADQTFLCDVDCDAAIDIFDVLKAIDVLLGRIQPPLECVTG